MTVVEPGDRVVDNVYQALPDPVDDTLLTLVMNLAAEVWTVRDRLRLVETALAGRGIPIEELVEEVRDSGEAIQSMRADRDAFVERVMAVLAPRGVGGSTQP